jgi:hypothetical protein
MLSAECHKALCYRLYKPIMEHVDKFSSLDKCDVQLYIGPIYGLPEIENLT